MEEPVVTAQMLIRKPTHEVFTAFADPDITTRFWFTRSSGKLEPGASVTWWWDMYSFSTNVKVLDLVDAERILIEWEDQTVEWRFEPVDGSTMVMITCRGFHGTDDEIVARAMDSTGGFNLVLAGAKAYLEHGLELNLVADHNPP